MRPCEDVIVTVDIQNPAMSLDMEFPAYMRIDELKKKLLDTLRLMDTRRFADMGRIEMSYDGQRLRDNATLATYGIWDGSIVKIKTERAR